MCIRDRWYPDHEDLPITSCTVSSESGTQLCSYFTRRSWIAQMLIRPTCEEFPDQGYLREIWPRKGMRFSEAGGHFSHGHISRVTCFFPVFFRGPVPEALPKHCVKKTWVENGSDGVFSCFRVLGHFSYLPSGKNEKVYLF